MDLIKIVWHRHGFSAEFHTPRFCCRNTLGLTLSNILTFVLRHKGQNLKHKVCDERTQKVFSLPCIQQRHINDTDIYLFLFCKYTPLILYLLIIASQPVDALDYEQIARL